MIVLVFMFLVVVMVVDMLIMMVVLFRLPQRQRQTLLPFVLAYCRNLAEMWLGLSMIVETELGRSVTLTFSEQLIVLLSLGKVVEETLRLAVA